MPSAPPPPFAALDAPPPLSPQQLAELERAGRALRRVRTAVTVARIDGWSVGLFGALTLIVGLASPSALLVGGALVAIAVVELRAARRLAALDVGATRTLGFNQLALGALLVLYGTWNLVRVGRGELSADYAAAIASEPQLAEMMQPFEQLLTLIFTAVYATVILVGIVAQGGMALYHFSRGKHLRRLVAETPAWVLDVHRAGVRA